MKQPTKRNQIKIFPERQKQKQTGEQKQGVMGVRQAPQAVRLCFKRRKPVEPKGFLTDRFHTTKKQTFYNNLKTMTNQNNTKAHSDYGESEAKTINNRFHRSDVSRCEWSERGLPREATRHKSRRERTRRTSQRFLAGGRPYPLQKKKNQPY